MSKERKISLYSTVGKVENGGLENVKNMDELRSRLKDLNIDLKGKVLVDVNTETSYEVNSTQDLPEGDLQLYILPAKTKSGNVYSIN